MQSNESVIGKHQAFTASSMGNKVTGAKAKYLDGFNITMNGLTSSTVVVAAASMLALINPFEVKVGGVPQIRTRMVDLFAFNVLALQHIPEIRTSGDLDNDEWIVQGLWVPCWWPPTLAETVVDATFNAVTISDNTEITITAEYLDRSPRKPALYYGGQEQNTSGVDSTEFGNASFTVNTIGDLIGILIFSTTVPGGATLLEDGTIQQIRITAGGRILGIWEWNELSGLPNMYGGQTRGVAQQGVPGTAALVSNHQWFPMTREPIPRGTQVVMDVMAGIDASLIRILPVQAIKLTGG